MIAASIETACRVSDSGYGTGRVIVRITALANGLPLYTCNPRDFRGIDGLTVVPVPVPTLRSVQAEAQLKFGRQSEILSRPLETHAFANETSRGGSLNSAGLAGS
jgi:hypothetical protein